MTDPVSTQSEFPSAVVVTKRTSVWLGWMPLLALGITIYLVFASLQERGLRITVRAAEGQGIRQGASVRYRGIQVGTVEEVKLESDLRGVRLMVRLDDDARELASVGTQFWIVYPRVGLDGIQGIETVVGARYLAVSPAEDRTERVAEREFEARAEPPVEDTLAEGGLDIVLDAPSRFGLEPGAPITYRGFWIGRVVSVELASDATVVEVRGRVAREYRALVRQNSVFWEESGIEMDLSLTGGITLDVGTLRSLLMGAVAMATPTYPGELAESGQRFSLVAGPEKDWLQWRPALPIGAGSIPQGLTPPTPLSSSLTWRSGRIIRQRKERSAWLIATERGLLGPADYFQVPAEAEESGVDLRVGNITVNAIPPVESQGEVAWVTWTQPLDSIWPSQRIRSLAGPEDCMVYAGPNLAPQSIAAYRMKQTPRGLEVSEDVRFSADWQGAPVVARSDGNLVGMLILVEGHAHIAAIPDFH
ncbi:MAG: MCE family protein [Planctomycetes bacterium]|nr:MCE family protein [Planctomycetota bacterium]MCB9911261.1 MCE family protein [Planctomycetota bacterium]HPF13741.1 MlaD family protein [Planctomycetota bacterium]HRV81553.1 MlaD family protein [Planctomycetota bacterium]